MINMSNNVLCIVKELYSKNAVLKAITDYQAISSIRLTENEHYYICSFNDCKYNLSETMKEFENYVIDLMNCRGINEYGDC